MKKTFIEFEHVLFAVEDLICVNNHVFQRMGENGEELYYTRCYLNNDIQFCIPDDKYEELKDKVLKACNSGQEINSENQVK